jgi:hypothetical protein
MQHYVIMLVSDLQQVGGFLFYSASSLKRQSVEKDVATTRTHYSDSVPTCLFTFSLMMRATVSSKKL